MTTFVERLKQRKLVQWALACAAAAFALLQGVGIVAQRFAWPGAAERALVVWAAMWDKYGAPDACRRIAAGDYDCAAGAAGQP